MKSEELTFENLAVEGLRLMGKKGKHTIEIGMHYTAPEGDFYMEIEDSEKGTANFLIFRNFQEVINFVEERFGKTNLRNFEKLANTRHIEMFREKHILKWKGLRGKRDIYKRLSHLPKEQVDEIL